ncbi:hypothetical protein AB0P40_34005 [Streptomyces sp. NPDC079189]|uniref:hypothetical protein n=1 Tax=Streptomyces sp. NPDC079189 TaxID=3154514 RepID=UPI00341BD944
MSRGGHQDVPDGSLEVFYVQGFDSHSHYNDGDHDLVESCPACEANSLVADMEFSSGRQAAHFCFTRGSKFDSLGESKSTSSTKPSDYGAYPKAVEQAPAVFTAPQSGDLPGPRTATAPTHDHDRSRR